jgi:hypothetical protein
MDAKVEHASLGRFRRIQTAEAAQLSSGEGTIHNLQPAGRGSRPTHLDIAYFRKSGAVEADL